VDTDLIERLRLSQTGGIHYEAADALEAQARRIVELEEGLKLERDTGTRLWEGALAYMKERNEARARIAELEAENEELKKAISKPWMGSARAAYLGEKE
jgi:hypothetical protein